MGRLITVEELPQYAGGDLKLDSVATGMPEFRMRVFRYAPSDISVPSVGEFSDRQLSGRRDIHEPPRNRRHGSRITSAEA